MTRNLPRTADFLNLQQESVAYGETNDCAVKAVAIAAQVPYSQAHAVLQRLGRKVRAGTPMNLVLTACRTLGVEPVRIDQCEITARYPGKHAAKQQVTTLQPDRFPRAWKDGHTYLMVTAGHILAVVDGTVHDWTRGQSREAKMLYRIQRAA